MGDLLGSAAHALFGIVGTLFPAVSYIRSLGVGGGFGGFVNGNNASLMMNFGIASGLGLLAHLLFTISGSGGESGDTDATDFLDLICEKRSWLIMACLSLNAAGVLLAGSKGGLLAMLLGFVLVLHWGFRTRAMVLVAAVVGSVLLMTISVMMQVPNGGNTGPSGRLIAAASTIADSNRIDHWQDTIRAVAGYFPCGSGYGTYGSAYLPYQATGRDLWFKHADNYWLELAVEQGLPGIGFALAIGIVLTVALLKLLRSDNDFDNGLAAVGLFVIAATTVSQSLDFGIIIPANAYTFVVLLAMLATRATTPTSASQTTATLQRKPALTVPTGPSMAALITRGLAGIAVTATAWTSLPALRGQASAEFVTRQATNNYQQIKTNSGNSIASLLSLPFGPISIQRQVYPY